MIDSSKTAPEREVAAEAPIRLKHPHSPTAQPIVRRVSDNPGRSRDRKPIAEEPFFRAAKSEHRADSPAPAISSLLKCVLLQTGYR